MARRPWLVPALAGVVAVAFLVAGIAAWRMFSPLPKGVATYGHPSTNETVIYFIPGPHRLHPLRAELLWAASAVFALVAVGTGFRRRLGPGADHMVGGLTSPAE